MAGVEVQEHWWNGVWGKLARYDIWLLRCPDEAGQPRWRVKAQRGGADSREWLSAVFVDEGQALAYLAHIKAIRANPGDPRFEWRDMVALRERTARWSDTSR